MVAMVVIRCPETDREIPTGIFTDLLRVHRLVGDAVLRLDVLIATKNIGGR